MTNRDEFRRRADECRRLAATASSVEDRIFWLKLVARWQVIERQEEIRQSGRVPAAASATTCGGGAAGGLTMPINERTISSDRRQVR